jgi:hypothetical protein
MKHTSTSSMVGYLNHLLRLGCFPLMVRHPPPPLVQECRSQDVAQDKAMEQQTAANMPHVNAVTAVDIVSKSPQTDTLMC